MPHKTLINGTSYNIKGGKTLINGTAYTINKGKTLINGTAYTINFEPDVITLVDANGYLGTPYDASGAESTRMVQGDNNTPTGSSINFSGFSFYHSTDKSNYIDIVKFGPINFSNYNHLYSYGTDIHTAECAALIRFTDLNGAIKSGYIFGHAGTKSYQSTNYNWYMNYSTGAVYTGDISGLKGEGYIQLFGVKNSDGSRGMYRSFFSNTWVTKA